ncbi:MAG: 7-carboxy-7-deazaguanine synthase QueE [Candidatus Omnitrophota bacterium]|jgi:organic radical activating enzyme
MKARIAEVFQSIQGEGVYLGKEQIFIRFYGCNLKGCSFCDTRLSSFNEYSPEDLLNNLKSYSNHCHSICLTGGEPLVQVDFLRQFLPLLKQAGFKLYLETNGTLPNALKDIINYIDFVAMDFKLPSSTGLRDFWQEHVAFLRLATKKEAFVKAVICNTTALADLEQAIRIISEVNQNIPFILQPNTFQINISLMNKIQGFKDFSLRSLSDVRIVPQMHKLVGAR